MLLNCPVNGNAQSREPVNQYYSRVSKWQKETIISFKNIAFSLPHSLYLNLHLIGSLQHCQNCILRTRRSFQTFIQCNTLGSKLLKGKERSFLQGIWGMPYHFRIKGWGTDLESKRNHHHRINSDMSKIYGRENLACCLPILHRWLLEARISPFHLCNLRTFSCLAHYRHEIDVSGMTNEDLCVFM